MTTKKTKTSSPALLPTHSPATPSAAPAASVAPAAPATGQSPTVSATTAPATAPPAGTITGVANAKNTGTKVDLQAAYAALVAGLEQYYQSGDTFPLSAGTLTRDQLVAEFQQFITAAETTKASNKAWRGDVQAERATLAQVEPLRQGVRSIVEGRFGKAGIQLLDFGFAPRKPTVKSAASKAGAVVKLKATRQARGTKGTVQREAVTGNVVGVTITPVTATTAAAGAQQATTAQTPTTATVQGAQTAGTAGGGATPGTASH